MKISERGQITLPKKVRDRHGLRPNTEVEIVEVNHQLVLRKKAGSRMNLDAVRGILRGHAMGKTTDEVMRELRPR
jgi:AbrB family looped-hinge helix DNA binding protein